MSSARDLLAVVLLILAVVLGALWAPATWLHHNVVEREGFLAITDPLAEDPGFQRTLSDSAVEMLLGDDRIPGWIEESLTPLAEEQAAALTGTGVYATMWKATMVELHGALFSPGASDLDVDLGPVIDRILTPVEEKLPIEIPRPEDATITLASIPDIPLLTRVSAVTPWAYWAGPAALVLLALALLIASHRRAMLIMAGLGGILAGAGVWWLGEQVQAVVPDSIDQAPFVGPIVQVFEGHFQTAMMPQGVIMLGAGALVTAIGLVLVGLRRRS
ncbi:MAG: hypothetical protein ACTMII_13105 [Brachybacterium sp.]|uniref:hypothetical protein n=1 Tax=unclassified Brachybacterium TaxID=2623841 RepID=UPI003F8DC87D